jgi:hypothetical protein
MVYGIEDRLAPVVSYPSTEAPMGAGCGAVSDPLWAIAGAGSSSTAAKNLALLFPAILVWLVGVVSICASLLPPLP